MNKNKRQILIRKFITSVSQFHSPLFPGYPPGHLPRLCENKKITPSFTTGIAKPPRIRALAQIGYSKIPVFTHSLPIGKLKLLTLRIR